MPVVTGKFQENALISRKIATEGMVLLKNRRESITAKISINGKPQEEIPSAKAPFLNWQETDALRISVPQGRFTLTLEFLGMNEIPEWNKWVPETTAEINRLIFLPA